MGNMKMTRDFQSSQVSADMKDKRRALRISLPLAGLLFISALAWIAACGGPKKPGAGTENVLLITLDTTRADRLSCYGYAKNKTPGLDALAERGVLFENAQSPAPLTLPSHCTIMTGLYPPAHGVRNNGSYALAPRFITMARIFHEQGLRTAAFVASFTVDSRFGLNQGFDFYDDQLAPPDRFKLYESERPAEAVYSVFRTWLEANAGNRFFAWVHFYDPHFPYTPPEPFLSQTADPYDGEIAYMDHYVGEISRLLQTLGLTEKTLIVVAGDHGEGFGEHKELGHQFFCYEETQHVPLVFVPPGQEFRGMRLKERVSLVDVLPTVLDLCGLPPQKQVQGRSLVPAMRHKSLPERDLYFESLFSNEVLGCAPLTGLYRQNLKWIDLPQPELYDLAADPGEQHNLAQQRPDEVRQLKAAEKTLAGDLGGTGEGRRQMDLRERERLASLGYISAGTTLAQGGNLVDPKERIDSFMQYATACELQKKGSLAEAERLLQQSLLANPGFAPAHAKLAAIALQEGKPSLAMERLKRGLEQAPADPGLKVEYATHLYEAGRLQEALTLLDLIDVASAPAYGTTIYMLRGQILEKQNNLARAVDSYRAALQIEPANRPLGRKLLGLLMAQERTAESFDLALQLLQQTPADLGLMRAVAVIAGRLGRFDQAEEYFQKALGLTSDPAILFDYAVVMSEKGDMRRALELMERFVALAGPGDEQAAMAQKLIREYKALLK